MEFHVTESKSTAKERSKVFNVLSLLVGQFQNNYINYMNYFKYVVNAVLEEPKYEPT